jgi:hypothetical protein
MSQNLEGQPGEAAHHGTERAEIDALRLEVAQLSARRARHPARSVPAALLIIVACILAPLSIVAVWANDLVGDTDRYTATVGPLAENPDVQTAVTNRVTDLIVQKIDIPAEVSSVVSALQSRGLSSQATTALSALSGPIQSGVSGFIHSTVAKVVTSSAFAGIWTNVNRAAHAEFIKALTGQGGGTVHLNGNTVTIDLAPVIEQVKTRLVAAGLGLASSIPAVHTNFTVLTSDNVPKIKTGFRMLQIAGGWLPVVTVLIGAIGVLLALGRRNALIGASIGVTVAMLILGAALAVGRSTALQNLPAGSSEPAATAVIDAILHDLRLAIRTAGLLAAVVALGAYLSGPTRSATQVRGYCATAIGAARHLFDRTGLDIGPVGHFVHRTRRWLACAVVLIAAVIFALWDHPTVPVVAWTTVIVLLCLAILEFLDTDTTVRYHSSHPARMSGSWSGR